MYSGLLITHSVIRYLLLVVLVLVIVNSFIGFSKKKEFTATDNQFGLTLFSLAHTQLLIGFLLYFFSPLVQFSGAAMKDATLRYWTSEHIVIMLLAILLITLARTTSKKMTDGLAKHRRMLVFNTIALFLILIGIAMAKRGFFSIPTLTSI